MGKDPAFLFYPGDWDGGTKLFTRSEKGAYMDLLIAQFNCGHMTIQEVGHILGRDFDMMWESRLKAKFSVDKNGRFFNEKLENEQKRRKEFTESRKQNLKGINQYTHMEGHTTSRMETETETKDVHRTYTFEEIWKKYPRKERMKEALKHFNASVKNDNDWKDINTALDNYCKTENVVKGLTKYIQQGGTWFNNWKDWVDAPISKQEPVSAMALAKEQGRIR